MKMEKLSDKSTVPRLCAPPEPENDSNNATRRTEGSILSRTDDRWEAPRQEIDSM